VGRNQRGKEETRVGDGIRFGRKLVSGLLLLSIVWVVGCASVGEATEAPVAEVPEEQVAEEQAATAVATEEVEEEPPAEVVATEEVEEEPPAEEPAAPEPEGPPREDLSPAEAWQPYPEREEPPVGDAELVPGYEPMRESVAAMDGELQERLLLQYGLQINTARTVVLSEEASARFVRDLYRATNPQWVPDVVAESAPCLSGQDCVPSRDSTVRRVGSDLAGAARNVVTHPFKNPLGSAVERAESMQEDCPGAASRTYVTTEDNEDNAYSGSPDGDMGSEELCIYKDNPIHPIEFYIDAPSVPPGFAEAWLSLRAWDVDEQAAVCPEVDAVYLNGNFVDNLRGADKTWSTSGPYPIDPAWVQEGRNLVEIEVNTEACLKDDGTERWCVGIQQGTLQLEGGGGVAYQRSTVTTPECWSPGSTGYVVVEADTTLESQEVMVEVLVIDDQDNVWAGDSQTGMIWGSEDDGFEFPLPMEMDAPRGDYTVQVFIYDTCSGTLQESQEYVVPIGCAPLVETVSIAPVTGEDLATWDQDKLYDLFTTEGVVLGMLVLETNFPDSLLPSGAYLERAWLDGNQGIVELVDVITGEPVYEVELLAEQVDEPISDVPTAAIYRGTKWCLTCLLRWYVCRPCFFWEPAMSLEECEALLP
jgi:hypothetical protein